MSTIAAQNLAVESAEESSVTKYLQQNPDFFERHPQLLTRLRLNHPRNGTTISLIERQVEVLRDKHAALEQKLGEFVHVARANDALADKIHRFTLKLLHTTTRAAALRVVETGLREDFDTYHGVLLLQQELPVPLDSRFMRVVRPDDVVFRSFDGLLTSGKPRCGQVRDSQRDYLFGAEAAEIGSVALVPLTELTPTGLLALGSVEQSRFHPGMSTEFLSRMGALIAAALVRS
jgi:uncharacterized protein YigA (DUF484 family)